LFVASDNPVKPLNWIVNLDYSPNSNQRWPVNAMLQIYNTSVHAAINLIYDVVPEAVATFVEDIAGWLVPSLGDHGLEIKKFAEVFDIPVGAAVLLNLFYELEAGCTSIVAQDVYGKITHGRNLDFDMAPVLRKLVVQLKFQKGGKTIYSGISYAGYVGVLTGLKQGAFAVTVNQRNEGNRIENILEALLVPGTRVLAFLVRETLENVNTFSEAVDRLASTSLIAPCYITMSGTKPGEGVVITRNRYDAADLWKLNPQNGIWNLVQTNDDHWQPDSDGRSTVAKRLMRVIGQNKINEDSLFSVLSTKPVLAPSTTYTTLMSSMTGNVTTYIREL